MLEFWFLLPTGFLVAVLATSSGIAGSNFWIPIHLLWLAFEPRVAFWISLLTMLFGSSSAMVRNVRAGTIAWPLVRKYLGVAGPAALLGAVLSTRIPVRLLLIGFAIFVTSYGLWLLTDGFRQAPSHSRHSKIRWPSGILAGGLHGTIATGSGILLMPAMIDHEAVDRPATAVGSTVVLVFSLTLVSVIFRIDGPLYQTLIDNLRTIASVMLFAAPGVVIGGQLGPRIAQRLSRRWLRLYVGVLLLAVGALVGWRAFATP